MEHVQRNQKNDKMIEFSVLVVGLGIPAKAEKKKKQKPKSKVLFDSAAEEKTKLFTIWLQEAQMVRCLLEKSEKFQQYISLKELKRLQTRFNGRPRQTPEYLKPSISRAS